MIRLRYHHLLCLEKFKGEGYSRDFCENMSRIKSEYKKKNFELVDGCDDICSHCPENNNGICKSQSKVEAYDAAVRAEIKSGRIPLRSKICSDCRWYFICRES